MCRLKQWVPAGREYGWVRLGVGWGLENMMGDMGLSSGWAGGKGEQKALEEDVVDYMTVLVLGRTSNRLFLHLLESSNF